MAASGLRARRAAAATSAFAAKRSCLLDSQETTTRTVIKAAAAAAGSPPQVSRYRESRLLEALFFIYVREREREREDERATEFAWYVAGRSGGGGGGGSGRRALLLYVRTSRTPTCHHYKHSRGWLASRHALTYIFLSLSVSIIPTSLFHVHGHTHTRTHTCIRSSHLKSLAPCACLRVLSLSLPPSPLLSTTGPAERGVNTRARAGTARSVAGSSARKCVRERARNRIVDVVLVLLVVVVVVVAVAPLTCARVCGCV